MSARLRRWWWRRVRRYRFELCRRCGRPVAATCPTYWTADDKLWREVEGSDAGIRCIPCFTEDAAAAGIHVSWHPYVWLRSVESPFEKPAVSEGYPMGRREREELRQAVDRTRRER